MSEAVAPPRRRALHDAPRAPAPAEECNASAATASAVLAAAVTSEVYGWQNLISIIACLSIARNVVSNYYEFGILIRIPLATITLHDSAWFAIFIAAHILRAWPVFLLRRHAAAAAVFAVLSTAGLAVLAVVKISHVYLSGWAHTLGIVWDMKLVSFIVAGGPQAGEPQLLREYLRFLVMPTLVFAPPFQRQLSCNLRRVCGCALKLVVYFLLFIAVMDQYAVPAIWRVCAAQNVLALVENSIDVSISSVFLFMLFFLMVFDCALVIISELTGFGEPVYSAWWNAQSAGDFWELWNLPVHRFLKCHVYKPLRRRGVRAYMARAACFLVSGAFHEMVVALALKKVSGTVFAAMVAQVPLIYAGDYIKRQWPRAANTLFWLSFCVIGQPLIALLVYRSSFVLR